MNARVPDVRWHFRCSADRLLAPPAYVGELIAAGRRRMLAEGWDLAVVVTDLPLATARRPLIAHASASHSVAVLSMPALGAVGVRRRLAETLVRLVAALVGDIASLEVDRHGGVRRSVPPRSVVRAVKELGHKVEQEDSRAWHVIGRDADTELCGCRLDALDAVAEAEAVPGQDAEDETDRYSAHCTAAVYRLQTSDGLPPQYPWDGGRDRAAALPVLRTSTAPPTSGWTSPQRCFAREGRGTRAQARRGVTGGAAEMIAQETIDRLLRFEEPRFPVVSVYAQVEVDPAVRQEFRARVIDLLSRLRPMADDTSLDHDVRMSLRNDMDRIAEAAEVDRTKPGTAAFFSCSGRDFFEEVELPRPLRDRVQVDATPWIRPLVAVLDEYHRICAVMIDKQWARVWELYIDEMQEIEAFQDRTLQKTAYASPFEEPRVRNKADELTKFHFRRTAGLLAEHFRGKGFDLLVIGGHQYEVSAFTEFLPREVRERIAGTLPTDPDTVTPAEVRKGVDAVVQRYEQEEQRRLVDEVLEAAAARKPAAVGLRSCLWAGSVAAVQNLLVHDEEIRPGVVCDRDGWLALKGETCPLCGEPTRRTPDVIDELVTTVIDESGTVKHVKTQTALREHVTAASLRFPLPPEPESQR